MCETFAALVLRVIYNLEAVLVFEDKLLNCVYYGLSGRHK